jgi:Domain of unknown function (DUF4232)
MSHDSPPVPGLDERLADLAGTAGRAATAPAAQTIRRRGSRRVVGRRSALTAVAVLVTIGGSFGVRHLAPVHRKAPPATPSFTPSPAPQQPPASPVPRPPATGSPTASAAAHSSARPSAGQPGSVATSGPPTESTVECARPDVVVSLGPGDAAMGHRSVALVFTNQGGRPCRITGYPAAAAVNASGAPVAQAQRTPSGYLGGLAGGSPPDVTLAPGEQASALLEGLARSDGSCTAYAGLSVTLPDDTATTRLPWTTDACSDLQVHPVVPGGTGQSP